MEQSDKATQKTFTFFSYMTPFNAQNRSAKISWWINSVDQVKELFCTHTTNKWKSENLNPFCSMPNYMVETTSHFSLWAFDQM